MEADKDRDGKISFEEFTKMVENTDISMSMTLGKCLTLYSLTRSTTSCGLWSYALRADETQRNKR